MAKGNSIVVSPEPRGRFIGGIVYGTPKPGTVMQVRAAVASKGGNFTWEAFNRSADGDRGIIAILCEDELQGKIETEAYANGDYAKLYLPVPGDELNVLKLDVAGTGDDFAIGDYLIVDDGTGKVILAAGSPQAEPFVCLETVTDPTADQLVHVMFTGY